MATNNFCNFWLLLYLLLQISDATLSKDDKKKPQTKLSSQRVSERGLVVETPKSKDIVNNYDSYCSNTSIKSFQNSVLGYVTPWNNHGYDVAKIFGPKFTHISPVWLQLKRPKTKQFAVHGGHDIDKGWIADVKKNNVKFLPRILFEFNMQDYKAIYSNQNEVESLASTIVAFALENGFDGYVLEVWSQSYSVDSKIKLANVIVHIAQSMHKAGLEIILVIPPPIYYRDQEGMFLKDDFDRLKDVVDAFSLMTYDYSNPQRPGPNSPLQWMEKCVRLLTPVDESADRQKILLGFNFYGNEYTSTGGSAILGNRFIEILQKAKPKLRWDDAAREHFFEYKDNNAKRIVYYPTLLSINERIDLAVKLNTGISIWEIGQGLDYFYDLL